MIEKYVFAAGFASPEEPGLSLSGGARARPIWAHIGPIFYLWDHMGPGHVRIRPATALILLMIPFWNTFAGGIRSIVGPYGPWPWSRLGRSAGVGSGQQGSKVSKGSNSVNGFNLGQRFQPLPAGPTFVNGSKSSRYLRY